MLSVSRNVRRFGLAAVPLLIGLAAAGGLARAENIAPQELEDNRKTCMSSCLEQRGDGPGCTAFCACSVEGLAKQITNEEYQAGKTAINNKQQPDPATIEKLTAISKSCRSHLGE
jgi:uncharacterized membrane protein